MMLASCASSENDDATAQARLPIIVHDDVDCEPHITHLSLREWVQLGDGLIYGEITEIEPYDETTIASLEQTYIYDAKQCKNIEGGLRITLQNVRGYLFDDPVSDTMIVYAGPGMSSRFGAFTPTIDRSKITWPKGTAPILQKGMVIGGPVFYHEALDKWSLFYGPILPMFEVVNGLVRFQHVESSGNDGCYMLPPIDTFDGKSLETLDSELQVLTAGNGVYLPRTERRWSLEGNTDGQRRQAVHWVGVCYTQAYFDQEAAEKNRECHTVADCGLDHSDCRNFRCISPTDTCGSDADCDNGYQCVNGTCADK